MLTSKELLEQTGISRATLNNYIARGLLPKPVVSRPEIRGKGPRQIGYFPEEAVHRIQQIQQFKREGLGLDEIAARLSAAKAKPEHDAPGAGNARQSTHAGAVKKQPLVVTVEQIAYPAYMVNYKFEVVWFNDAARDALGAVLAQLAPRTAERSIFRLLLLTEDARLAANREELLRLNLALAKERMGLSAITQPLQPLAAAKAHLLEQLYAETAAVAPGPIVEFPLRLRGGKGATEQYCAYAAYFREGILVVLSPLREDASALLQLLSRRDVVIRNLLSKRLPTLTDLAVLVADLQDSVKICSELPPEEYFELINQIWSAAGAVFRKYYGTHGKHVGDGMVYYFFPQPDCNYIMNAVVCAHELKSVMARISKEWQLRKRWTNELYLNTGLNEGQEWLGTFQTATTVEFAVLGETINHTARLSDFARHGAIWATKNFIGKVPSRERARIRFGIHRPGPEGQSIFVESTYSRLANLVDLSSGRHEKLRDIAGLSVTEIVDVAAP
ncbi:MAG TPA: adenylate/guanylate cyclase domain-containing protein [Burkholderiales bacterium]|nr:adenylate/guanylate cyclase domain-containing protein [Burkholderiales bacterium]